MKQLTQLTWAPRVSSFCFAALLFQIISAYKLTTHSENLGDLSSHHSGIQQGQHQRKTHSERDSKSILSNAELDQVLNMLEVDTKSESASSSILMLEPFYEIVMMMRKQGFSPDSIAMMNNLTIMIRTVLKPNLNASAANLSASLFQTYGAGYALCDQQFAAAFANTAANVSLHKAAANNSACRANQSLAATNTSNCQSLLAAMNSSQTSNCTKAWYNGPPPATATCPKMLTGETWGVYTQRFQNYFASLYVNMSQAALVCEGSSGEIAAQARVCSAANATLASVTGYCNGVQATMDNAACTAYNYNVQMCANYTSCYDQFTSSYRNYLDGVNSQLTGLRNQLSAMMQIECMLSKLINSKANITCPNVTITLQLATAQLQLTYPTPVPKVPQPCPITAILPGSVAYNQSFYSGLPSNAAAQVCQATCCPVCSSFGCPTGTRRGVGPSYMWGNTSSVCCVQNFCYCRTLNQPPYYCDDATTYNCTTGQVCTSVTPFAFGANPCQASR